MPCPSIVPKKFWTFPNYFERKQTIRTWFKMWNSVVKSFFGSVPKDSGKVQNNFGLIEEQGMDFQVFIYVWFSSSKNINLLRGILFDNFDF